MQPDFFAELLSLPGVTPDKALGAFFLSLFRIAPMVAFAPFLGAKLPGMTKIGLAAFITLVLVPHAVTTATGNIPFDMAFIGHSLKELLIGFTLSFLVSVPFYVAESAGTLIDFQRGSSSLMMQDPTMQNQVSPIGLIYNYTTILIFFIIGGQFFLFSALIESFSLIPVDGMLHSKYFSLQHPIWQTITHVMTHIFAIAIQLAAPSLIAILMAEMFLGIANRLATQVQIAFLGMSLKSLLGLFLLWTAWFFIVKQIAKESSNWLMELNRLLHLLIPA